MQARRQNHKVKQSVTIKIIIDNEKRSTDQKHAKHVHWSYSGKGRDTEQHCKSS
jgi:hypothetical protein